MGLLGLWNCHFWASAPSGRQAKLILPLCILRKFKSLYLDIFFLSPLKKKTKKMLFNGSKDIAGYRPASPPPSFPP